MVQIQAKVQYFVFSVAVILLFSWCLTNLPIFLQLKSLFIQISVSCFTVSLVFSCHFGPSVIIHVRLLIFFWRCSSLSVIVFQVSINGICKVTMIVTSSSWIYAFLHDLRCVGIRRITVYGTFWAEIVVFGFIVTPCVNSDPLRSGGVVDWVGSTVEVYVTFNSYRILISIIWSIYTVYKS